MVNDMEDQEQEYKVKQNLAEYTGFFSNPELYKKVKGVGVVKNTNFQNRLKQLSKDDSIEKIKNKGKFVPTL